MQSPSPRIAALVILGTASVLALTAGRSLAYIDLPPATLGRLCDMSMHISVVRVDKVDREKRRIIYRAVQDLKGNSPSDYWKQVLDGDAALSAPILKWAEPGKSALFFGSAARNAGYCYVDGSWYLFAANEGAAQWWRQVRVEPRLLLGYAGTDKSLAAAVTDLLKGKEVEVVCRVPREGDDAKRTDGKPAHIRASLKRLDYNVKRDFVRWADALSPTEKKP